MLGRNFLNNFVDSDAAFRNCSSKFFGAEPALGKLIKNMPIMFASDFGAAFPALVHQRIWLVLEFGKFRGDG